MSENQRQEPPGPGGGCDHSHSQRENQAGTSDKELITVKSDSRFIRVNI